MFGNVRLGARGWGARDWVKQGFAELRVLNWGAGVTLSTPMARTKGSSPILPSSIADLLRDLAAVQRTKQSKWGYERAAEAIAALPAPIESFLLTDGTLRKIPQVGPSSTRVILEVLQTGGSPTVEQAIAESGKARTSRRAAASRHTSSVAPKCWRRCDNKRLRGRRSTTIAATCRCTRPGATAVSPSRDHRDGMARGYEYSA